MDRIGTLSHSCQMAVELSSNERSHIVYSMTMTATRGQFACICVKLNMLKLLVPKFQISRHKITIKYEGFI